MGKRRNNLVGLAFFAKELFVQPQEPQSAAKTAPDEVRNAVESHTSTLSSTLTRKASEQEASEESEPQRKKRKVGLLGPNYEKFDATGLVPHYTDASEVPEHLQKYFYQRERYFSLYSSGCLLDDEGWYSVTPELIATQIAERCRCDTILDAFCGVGGNAIAFAKTCERVIAIDNSPTRLALARHNAVIYGVEDRIEFILGDFISFAKAYLTLPPTERKIDVVFLSPPWGGPEYLSGGHSKTTSSGDATFPQKDQSHGHPEFHLDQIQPLHGRELFQLARRITNNIAYFLPRNTDMKEIASLLEDVSSAGTPSANGVAQKPRSKREMVEVEEEWMGPKLKALTCYFGGLAAGQEDLFEQ